MVEHKPFDSLAKLVVGLLASPREWIPEAELRLPTYGDILLRPGPVLEPSTGLLGTLVGDRLVLLEFFSERPRLGPLVRIRAKGFLGVGLELQRKTGFAALRNARIMIIGNGCPKSLLTRLWPGRCWEDLGAGLKGMKDWPEVYYIDLLRLPVTAQTAWLHLAGKSHWTKEALEFLVSSPEAATQALLSRLNEEIPQMLTPMNTSEERGTRRFLKAWEEVAALQRGRAEGRTEGHKEGMAQAFHRMLRLMLSQRFGESSQTLLTRVKASSDLHWLETLAVRLTQGAELSELEALPTTEDVVSA